MEKNTVAKFNNIAHFYNSFIFQIFYFWIHKFCLSFCQKYLKDDYKILDVACGTGKFLNKIKRWDNIQSFGIDNSCKMIDISKKEFPKNNFCVASAEDIPFQNNFFDFITIIDAIYYFQDKKKVLRECSRVLKPNGYLFIYYPAFDVFPDFIIKQIKFLSKIIFWNLEEYSVLPKIAHLEKDAKLNYFKLIKKNNILLNRFILFQKI